MPTVLRSIGRTEIDRLRERAKADPKGRPRINVHSSLSDRVQEMVIALRRGKPILPHRQLGKRKSYYVIEGRFRVTFLSAHGRPIEELIFDARSSDHRWAATFNAGTWHGIEAETDIAIYLEVIAGPFVKGRTEWLYG
ncbi:MAG: cupin fold metalloprotein, WbuC family [Alphaproteobacteria bacterium]|nr:cupin fold metalloprotein, WbuC family [Alphaproteobacteria bacterium]